MGRGLGGEKGDVEGEVGGLGRGWGAWEGVWRGFEGFRGDFVVLEVDLEGLGVCGGVEGLGKSVEKGRKGGLKDLEGCGRLEVVWGV